MSVKTIIVTKESTLDSIRSEVSQFLKVMKSKKFYVIVDIKDDMPSVSNMTMNRLLDEDSVMRRIVRNGLPSRICLISSDRIELAGITSASPNELFYDEENKCWIREFKNEFNSVLRIRDNGLIEVEGYGPTSKS